MRVGLRLGQHHLIIDLQFDGTTCRATIDGTAHVVVAQRLDATTLSLVIAVTDYLEAKNNVSRLPDCC